MAPTRLGKRLPFRNGPLMFRGSVRSLGKSRVTRQNARNGLRNGRERIVLLAADEYRRLKRRAREVLLVTELSDEDIKTIADSKMDSRHNYLNEELK